MEENALLKSSLIQKTSELELKDFHIRQKDQKINTLTQENENLK